MSIFDGVFLATLLRALSQIVASKYVEEYGFYSAFRHTLVPPFVIKYVCWFLKKVGYKDITPTEPSERRGELGNGEDYWDPNGKFSDYFAMLTLLPYFIYFTVSTFTIILGTAAYPAFHVRRHLFCSRPRI